MVACGATASCDAAELTKASEVVVRGKQKLFANCHIVLFRECNGPDFGSTNEFHFGVRSDVTSLYIVRAETLSSRRMTAAALKYCSLS